MNFYIPSYEDCISIVSSNPEGYFYEKLFSVDDYDISIFGYRYASYNNFLMPIIGNHRVNALEMKGIAFIFNDDGTIFRHNLLLPKFWELNQYDHCKYEIFSNSKIKNVTIKEDGFLVSFLKLPNEKILSFTKHSFSDPVNKRANKYLSNTQYYNFIKNCLDNNIQPIFELVGTEKMTVNYDTEKLILLKLRNNITGEFIENPKIDGILVVDELNFTLDDIINMSNSITNQEGWVVHFEDGTLLKVKTKWWVENKNKRSYGKLL